MDAKLSRRVFLKLVGATGAGATLATSAAGGVQSAFAADDDSTTYYETGLSSNDNTDVAALNELEALVVDEEIATVEESVVLLRNENAALPLAEGANVTLLGASTVNEFLGRNSTGASLISAASIYSDWTDSDEYADYDAILSYVDAMGRVYNVNQDVIDAYTDNTETWPGRGVQEGSTDAAESAWGIGAVPDDFFELPVDAEAPVSFYEDNNLTATFSSYGDAAFIIFTREGNEDNDLGQSDGVDGISELALQPNEVALLQMAQSYKEDGTFDRIIVLLNTAHALEVGSLPDYGVDAVLWIGAPGSAGIKGLTNILTGAVSPSGCLADTHATNSLSAPANMNACQNTGIWANSDEILDGVGYTGNESNYSGERNFNAYVVEAEGIYTGYRYYETRYEDCILGQGSADGTAGTYASDGGWDYTAEMTYPFGYGLSYTTFEQTLDSTEYSENDDAYHMDVTVTNTGDTYAGKYVVQVYAQTPYGDYERENAIEKAAVQLVGFAKTSTLDPGASETVTVDVKRYFLASYDSQGAGGYILSEGDYYLAVGDDAHDALNNILAAKGASGMTDVLGNATEGDAEKVYTFNQASLDSSSYRQSRVNSAYEVANRFDDARLDYWLGDDAWTLLTRNDWEGTYPVSYGEVELNATADMITELSGPYESDDSYSVDDYTLGADNGLTLIMMRDVDFDDNVTWDQFLDQFTMDELTYLLNAGTEVVEEFGIPGATQIDDNTAIGGSFLAVDSGSAQKWPSEINTASTFNMERFEARGRLMGLEAWFSGYNEVWYGGGNYHRTQFCGRNQQYYSEDGILGWYVGAGEAKAMQDVGVVYCQKHFAGNNQEQARESHAKFFTEQAFRETELRCYEGPIVDGGEMGLMGGFNRLGLTFCNYSRALNTDVLRNEWGFKGRVTTDAIAGSIYKQNWPLNLAAGTDYFCFNAMLSMSENPDAVEGITTAVNDGDGYALYNLRQAVKRTCYVWAHTWSVNGLSSSTRIESVTPWWKTAGYAAMGITGIGAVAALAASVAPQLVGNKEGDE